MEIHQAKNKFIESWGRMAASWGISKTMAQVHALLLVSCHPMTSDEIMEDLQISRGNAHLSLKSLVEWDLVYKEVKLGQRKEFFIAEKNMWEVIKRIVLHRRKKELEPVKRLLQELGPLEGGCAQSEEFNRMIHDLRIYTNKADAILDLMLKAESNWFISKLTSVVK